MVLNPKALHAKFYNLVYNKDLPESLCDYFWKLVFAIPLFILLFPFSVFWIKGYKHGDLLLVLRIILNVIISIGVFGLSLICVYFPIWEKDYSGLYVFLALVGAVGLALGIAWAITSLKTGIRFRYIETPESIIIVKESIKAFKNKYCPRIDWKEKVKEHDQNN